MQFLIEVQTSKFPQTFAYLQNDKEAALLFFSTPPIDGFQNSIAIKFVLLPAICTYFNSYEYILKNSSEFFGILNSDLLIKLKFSK